MFTLEISVNHSDGDRVSYNWAYNLPQTFETVELAVDFKKSFIDCYRNLFNIRDITTLYTLPVKVDGIYDKIVSVKIVLVEDFNEMI